MGLRLRRRREFLDRVDRGRSQRRYKDPLTGDLVGLSDRISLVVQSIMRRWLFVAAYTTLTVIWWTKPLWFGSSVGVANVRWQDWASYMALLIESVVGIGMFSWARRDSIVLRKIHGLERKAEHQEENAHVLLHDIYRLTQIELEQIKILLEIKTNGNGHAVVEGSPGDNGGSGPPGGDGDPGVEHQDPPGGQDAQGHNPRP